MPPQVYGKPIVEPMNKPRLIKIVFGKQVRHDTDTILKRFTPHFR